MDDANRLPARAAELQTTHYLVAGREEMELTGPELGVGGWTTITVAKF